MFYLMKFIIFVGAVFTTTSCASKAHISHNLNSPFSSQSTPNQSVQKSLSKKYQQFDILLADYESEVDIHLKKKKRNAILNDLIYLIDDHYYHYKNSLLTGRGELNFWSDVAVLGLNTASIISPGEHVKNILTSISTGIIGSRASYSDNFFQSQTSKALVTRMDASRNKMRAEMITFMSFDVERYPLREGLKDTREYLDKGNIVTAMTEIAEDLVPVAEAAKNDLRNAKLRDFDDTSEEYATLFQEARQKDEGHREKVFQDAAIVIGGSFIHSYNYLYEKTGRAALSFHTAKNKFILDAKNKNSSSKAVIEALRVSLDS